MTGHLLCVGLGYCAAALASRLHSQGWRVSGSSRSGEGTSRIRALGYAGVEIGSGNEGGLDAALGEATHLLVSAPPEADGDPLLRHHRQAIAASRSLVWIGYLSTIGVYGDRQGGWVDEDSEPHPGQERSRRRLQVEGEWLRLGRESGKRVQIFRIAGIYGPGRNQLESLLEGSARRLVKPGQVFNRIHVEDIAASLAAAIGRGGAGRIYNLSDDGPAPPDEVLVYAAGLLGLPAPEPIPYDAALLSPMAASFYAENRRVSNRRLHEELGVTLTYPTYREGLSALAASLLASRSTAGTGA